MHVVVIGLACVGERLNSLESAVAAAGICGSRIVFDYTCISSCLWRWSTPSASSGTRWSITNCCRILSTRTQSSTEIRYGVPRFTLSVLTARLHRMRCVALRWAVWCGAARCVVFATTCRSMPQFAAIYGIMSHTLTYVYKT